MLGLNKKSVSALIVNLSSKVFLRGKEGKTQKKYFAFKVFKTQRIAKQEKFGVVKTKEKIETKIQ